MTARRTPSSIPPWLASLPKDARLTREEVARLFGFASAASLAHSMAQGRQPELKAIEKILKLSTKVKAFYPATKVRNLIRAHIKEQQHEKANH